MNGCTTIWNTLGSIKFSQWLMSVTSYLYICSLLVINVVIISVCWRLGGIRAWVSSCQFLRPAITCNNPSKISMDAHILRWRQTSLWTAETASRQHDAIPQPLGVINIITAGFFHCFWHKYYGCENCMGANDILVKIEIYIFNESSWSDLKRICINS